MDAGPTMLGIIGAITGAVIGAVGGAVGGIATFVDGWFSPIARLSGDPFFSAKMNVTGGARGGAFVGVLIGAVTGGLGSLTIGIAVAITFDVVVVTLVSHQRGEVPLRTWFAVLLGGGLAGAVSAFAVDQLLAVR